MKIETYNKNYLPQEIITPANSTVYIEINGARYQISQLGEGLQICVCNSKLNIRVMQSDTIVISK